MALKWPTEWTAKAGRSATPPTLCAWPCCLSKWCGWPCRPHGERDAAERLARRRLRRRHEAALAGSGAGSSRAHYECVFQRDNQLPRDIKAEIRAPANLP